MADYKLTNHNVIIRNSDGANIPTDPDNSDYQRYLSWVADGNTADAADPIDPWAAIRNQRDALLQLCDWTQLADSPLDSGTKAAWATYRQSLRNIPQDFESPESVVWPTPPA